MRNTKPNKISKSKLNSTMAIYHKNPNFLPSTVSNREAHNLSQKSRAGNRKQDIAYVKQMMNKTVLIQNQDYSSFNSHISGVRHNIGARVDSK